MRTKDHGIQTSQLPNATTPHAVTPSLHTPPLSNSITPFWLKRLDRVKEEFRSTSWPATAEEGLYQVLALSGQGWAQLMSSLKVDNPKASARQIESAAHQLLWRWDDARSRMKTILKNRKTRRDNGME